MLSFGHRSTAIRIYSAKERSHSCYSARVQPVFKEVHAAPLFGPARTIHVTDEGGEFDRTRRSSIVWNSSWNWEIPRCVRHREEAEEMMLSLEKVHHVTAEGIGILTQQNGVMTPPILQVHPTSTFSRQ